MSGHRVAGPAPSAGIALLGWPAAPGLPALSPGRSVHLVGVAGAGMSGLARVMAARGLLVTGSDRHDSETAHRLRAEGIPVAVGHRADQVPPDCALVVRSPAVPDECPELAAARSAGVPVTKRAVLLGALMDAALGVAVAGTHGKTTTSGLIAFIALRAGLEPTVFVGGDLPDLGTNALAGMGRHVVLEADEYDRSFLHGHPWLAVVTNVEHDHPDIYPDLDAVCAAFLSFVRLARPDGLVLLSCQATATADFAAAAGARVERYGLLEELGAGAPEPEWLVTARRSNPEGQQFDVLHRGAAHGEFHTRLPGRHNAANCLAAIAAASAMGAPMAVVRDSVAAYRGASRRFQIIGSAAGATVIDDYAHHPSEIAATLSAARERFAGRRLWAIMEPHTYSRVAALAHDFGRALRAADETVITPVYAAREAPVAGSEPQRIAESVPGALLATSLEHAARHCAAAAAAGDVLLFLGAGDVPVASRACLRLLRERAAEAALAEAVRRSLGGQVTRNALLAAHTSLRVGGPVDVLVRASEVETLVGWWLLSHQLGLPVRVLGRGTNVLVSDAGLAGVAIVNRCERWQVEAAGDAGLVVAESGVTLAALAHALAREGWSGLEPAAGIPGSIGAALATNAGAHGWSMADSLVSAEVVSKDGAMTERSVDSLALRYRGSALRGDPTQLVVRLSLAVTRGAPEEIEERIAGLTARRRATQPASPSAGSMFKNPPGDYAGRLIEAAGLKGTVVGGARISPVHANFFVNLGTATAEDIAALVALARETVAERFGIRLELEIEPLGDDDAP